MPKDLVRYQKSGAFHFLTFSCYRRSPMLARPGAYDVFESELEAARRKYEFVVAGYVLMPEHVHLLVAEPRRSTLSVALQVLKQNTSRKLKNEKDTRFWQARYYDFNVRTGRKQIEKLRYMHRNPVARGLVAKPEDWSWSSFRHYATGIEGTVEIESEWTARRREANTTLVSGPLRNPPLAKHAKDGGHPPNRSGREFKSLKVEPPSGLATDQPSRRDVKPPTLQIPPLNEA